MDYLKFSQQLPRLYENWGQESVAAKNGKFEQLLNQEQAKNTATANVMQLLNLAVDCMEPDEIYCQIGIHRTSLLGAILDHPDCMAYVVDKLSEGEEDKIEQLLESLQRFNLEEQVIFCDQAVEDFWLELREVGIENKIGVYFYHGCPDYRSTLLGLLLSSKFLANQSLIIVAHANSRTVQQATWDFMANNPECQVVLELFNSGKKSSGFGNGLQVLSWDVERSDRYSVATFQEHRQQPVIQGIQNLQNLEATLDRVYQEALICHQQQELDLATKKYQEYLLWRSNDANAWFNLGQVYYEAANYQEAIAALLKSLEIDAERGELHYLIGLCLVKLNHIDRAIAAYQQALELNPNLIDAYHHLGTLLEQKGQIYEAETIYQKAIASNPNHFGSYLNLGNLLLAQERVEEAIASYETALNLNPEHSDMSPFLRSVREDILHNLEIAQDIECHPEKYYLEFAKRFYQQRQYEKAIVKYRQFLEVSPGDAFVYEELSDCFDKLNQTEAAINTLQAGVNLHPTAATLHFSLITKLLYQGRTSEAIASAENASRQLPEDYTFTLMKNLIVPLLYHTPEEISFYHQRFQTGLQNLIEQTSLTSPEEKTQAFLGIGRFSNFYLAYQARNVVEEQRIYGNFLHKIMAANYPQWVEPLSMPPVRDKIRIGYVSNYLHSYSGTLWLTGWLRYSERQKFEIYCYYTGNYPDPVTQQFREYSHVFHHIPGDFAQICQQIIADKLHILVFPELGMDPPTLRLAALRLAPIQCTAWGHPVTSGIPTIDYFISSELMEPENAQEHYSETLIRLPNIGVAYPKPKDIPAITKTRTDFELPEDAVIYLCCQAPFKYLPQYDYIFPEIARRVPQAKFVFLRGELLKKRLNQAFAAVGLKACDYCLHRQIPARSDYLMLNLISDVFLDTFTWSGGNTSLEAIACNLPIVTCPGEFMRGRHADSFLKMIGVTETIAQTEAEYIDIAVKLGLDPQWRQHISEKMRDRQDLLFDDQTCVKALEAFYQEIVEQKAI